MAGGGRILYIHNAISALQLSPATTTNDAFNVCAVLLGHQRFKTLVVIVYKTPWATCDDTKAICKQLDDLLHHHADHIIVAGDFNLPHMHWPVAASSTDTSVELLLRRLVHEHYLTQLAQQPTRKSVILDLILVSSSLESSRVVDLPPIVGCDHSAQQLLIYSNLESVKSKLRNVVNYEYLISLLSQIVSAEVFCRLQYNRRFCQLLYIGAYERYSNLIVYKVCSQAISSV